MMKKQQSIAQARTHLPGLVREAESGGTIELTRRGEPVAVLIGRRQFARLLSTHARFTESYREFIRDNDLAELAIDPEAVFAGARDATPGREVDL